jgi:hypothetical protein
MPADLELSVEASVVTTWRLDTTPATFSQAKSLAPRLAVDPTRRDWFASDPKKWLDCASLAWRNSASDLVPVSEPNVDVRRLGLRGGNAFSHGEPGIPCTVVTRPFQGQPEIRDGLPRVQGFVLQVPTASPELEKEGSPTPDPPFFVESWQLLDDERDVRIHIYWMFNAASGLDADYALLHNLEHQTVELALRLVLRHERLAAVAQGEQVALFPGESLIRLSLESIRRDLEEQLFQRLEYVHEAIGKDSR